MAQAHDWQVDTVASVTPTVNPWCCSVRRSSAFALALNVPSPRLSLVHSRSASGTTPGAILAWSLPEPIAHRRIWRKSLVTDIGTEIDRRAITRLCHFTRLMSLEQIVHDRAILSTRELIDRGRSDHRNDSRRYDGHLDYISCSVQYPNLYVLDSFRREQDDAGPWVVVLLDPKLLELSSTRFSPVNAATANGDHVSAGPDGFASMFQPNPPSVHRISRSSSHLKCCPTDHQAEVLIHQSISTECIIGVVCESNRDCQQVNRLFSDWMGPPPECSKRSTFFETNYVSDRIQMGHEMLVPIRDS